MRLSLLSHTYFQGQAASKSNHLCRRCLHPYEQAISYTKRR
ncbi:hypothetical protein CGRA01v4_03126 [Colletotrichum graminicola]|nr:hypothetical protein CGRA01v4_03126 [Colletotrichum graminicola]